MNQDGPKHLDVTLSRAKFDELTADLVDGTMGPVRQALSDAGLSASEIDKVLLVGGSTRIPAVQEAVKKYTGKEPFKGINPDECVAVGAAIQGGKLAGDEGAGSVLLLDVTPLSLGIETLGGVATKLIDRNTTIPTNKNRSSLQQKITRQPLISTLYRVKDLWQEITKLWVSSNWTVSLPQEEACLRLKLLSISTQTVS